MKNYLFFSILVLVSILANPLQLLAQKHKGIPPEHPQLVIGIVIQDMRYDYLYRFWDNFGDGGFRKLIDEGTLCKNATYNYMLTQNAPGLATIVSGCEPAIHGIVSDNWFQRLQSKKEDAIYDEKEKTIGPNPDGYHFSPGNLLTTTVFDELKLFNNFRSKVVSVSLEANGAIIPAGHLGDEAFWFDDATGKWVTSTYYADSLPTWVKQFNDKNFPDIYLERDWLPMLSLEHYRNGALKGLSKSTGFASENKFAKKISGFIKKGHEYGALEANPFGISLTKDFAISAIVDDSLGMDEYPDFLNITFSPTAKVSQACGPNSIELEDMYIYLDRELAHLLQFLDDNFGKQTVLIYLTSDHGTAYDPNQLIDARIPAGVFNSDRAIMLLGTYLNAIYDKGKWVSTYQDRQIYLNRQLIEDAGLKLNEVQETVSRFMIQFTGVANAATSITLEETHFTQGVFSAMQNSYNQKRSGDVLLNLEPGWIEKGDYLTSSGSANNYDVHVPLIWYGWKIKRNKISRSVDMRDIAPTLSNFLDIPFPNGCTGSVIDELEK